MKNQREIYEALLAGETLIDDDDIKVKLNSKGKFVFADNGNPCGYTFLRPDTWQIYKEPKWYENIPDGGVLCWCRNGHAKPMLSVIVKFTANNFMIEGGYLWDWAKPLTKQKIQVFKDNAPEITGCRHNLLPDNPSDPQYYKCTKCNHVQGASV